MAKRIPHHIRARSAVSEAIIEFAFAIANDTFDQKWSGAGANLLTASLGHLCSEAVHVNRQLKTVKAGINLDEDLVSLLQALSKSDEGRALLSEQAQATKNADLAAVFKKLATGQTRGVNLPDLSPALSKGGDHVPITGVAVAMLAMVHSTFNTDSVSYDSGADAYSIVKQLRCNLELSLFAACLKGTNPIEISSIVALYANDLLTSVVDLTRAVRDGAANIAELYARSAGTAAEKLGKEIAKWSTEIRQAQASITSASALCLGGFTTQRTYLTDPTQIVRRAFSFEIPDGKNTEIGALQEGELADIAGRVTDVTVRRKGEHLITTIGLIDPSSGKSITAALSFVNGNNIGITIDAFVCCTGVFHEKSTLNQNKPAFHVMQLPMALLTKSSWRAGFLSLGSTFMEVWPNGHLIQWTIGHHTTTEFEQLGTGAGEVLFRLIPNVIGKW